MSDAISSSLDMVPLPKTTELTPFDGDGTIKADADYAKQNIRELLETGKETLLEMIDVAKNSESPRAYEVVATLMKQLADMNSQLLDLHQKEQAATPREQTPTSLTQVNNPTFFVGTTMELSKAIEGLKK